MEIPSGITLRAHSRLPGPDAIRLDLRLSGKPVPTMLALAAMGLPAHDALGAASWRARAWLGWNASLDEGAPADFVVYDRNPLDDLSVLLEPQLVVLRGRPVACG